MTASQTAAGPLEAVKQIDALLGEAAVTKIAWSTLCPTFAPNSGKTPAIYEPQLAGLATRGAAIHLIDCVDRARPNMALTRLEPVAGTRAAGVPLFMEVAIENFSDAMIRDAAVILEEDGHARPAVKFETVPPRRAIVERFPVRFSAPGEHRITARLESDAVAADNFRHAVVDFPPDVPVLIIDGAIEATDARFLSAALAPGGPTRGTGIRPRIEMPRYLSLNPLDAYRAIYLANVERLDESAIEALDRYVSGGGGLAIFLGPQSRAALVNEQLYRDGKGLFPMPVSAPAELAVDRVEKTPDLEVTDHPVFHIFAGQRNSFLGTVNVSRYFATPEGWTPAPGSTVAVIARLRNGAPLAVERTFGEGRVVAFTTTAAPVWNNWAANNPSFVVAIQELQAYLARQPSGGRHSSGRRPA